MELVNFVRRREARSEEPVPSPRRLNRTWRPRLQGVISKIPLFIFVIVSCCFYLGKLKLSEC